MTRIIMPSRRQKILPGRRQAPRASCAAAVGVSTWRSFSRSPTAIAAFPDAAMATTAFAVSSRRPAEGPRSTGVRRHCLRRHRQRDSPGARARRGALNPCRFALTNSLASDWPQFGGPAANGISPETGINTDWTAHVPPVLWSFQMHDSGGYAHNTIVNGTVYIVDHAGSRDILRALDLTTGVQRWESGYEDAKSADNGFMRGCPVYRHGKTLHIQPKRECQLFRRRQRQDPLVAEPAKGIQRPEGQLGLHGFAASLTAISVICVPGGQGLPSSPSIRIPAPPCGRAGAMRPAMPPPWWQPSTMSGSTSCSTPTAPIGVRADDGVQLWRHQWTTQHDCNAQSPIVMGNKVFITSGYGVGCAMLEIGENWKVTEIWKDKEIIGRTARPILYRATSTARTKRPG